MLSVMPEPSHDASGLALELVLDDPAQVSGMGAGCAAARRVPQPSASLAYR